MLDLKIKGATILDGTGAEGFLADVGISEGLITQVGNLKSEGAAREVDGEGRVLSPGFIDIHSHDDFNLPVNPLAPGKIQQGVTTLVNGNCGMSPAPILPENRTPFLEFVAELDSGLAYDWKTMADFLSAQPPHAPNIIQLVGQGTLRLAVMGPKAGQASAAQLDTMKGLVAESMGGGAWGLSTMLVRPPSGHADTREIIELARVAARYGGGYHTHMRNEGTGVMDAVAEALEIGRKSGAAVQISHLKISNPEFWGNTVQIKALIEQARKDGVRVHADQYPYAASSGGLASRLPLWVEQGGTEAMLDRLRQPDSRARIRAEMLAGPKDNPLRIAHWDGVMVAVSPGNPSNVGLNLVQIAQRDGIEPVDAFLNQLLVDAGRTIGIYFFINEDDLREIMRDPHVAVGSDGLYMGVPGQEDSTQPHPRYYGTFSRVLGRYAREEGLLSLPEAVRKMTSLPAAILGVANRGRIALGAMADLVLFDPETVLDQATFENPHQAPLGIQGVWVNGVPVVEEGTPTGAAPGRILRRQHRS